MKLNPEHLDTWFKRVRGEFQGYLEFLKPFTRPLVYVEIGSWGGASAEFVAKNVLSHHPDSMGISLDPFEEDLPRHSLPKIRAIQSFAHERIRRTRIKWIWIQRRSQDALRSREFEELLGERGIDLLYIDGNHSAEGVVVDFALAWPFLRPGSVVIFDDFRTRDRKDFPHVKEAHAALSIAWSGWLRHLPVDSPKARQRAVLIRKNRWLPKRRG